MKNNHILIIEDDFVLIEDLPRALNSEGFVSEAYSDFGKAIERLKDSPFDCVLLDIKMPPTDDMDDDEVDSGRSTGVVLCKRVREARPNIPILAFTTVGDPYIHRRICEAGANAILLKPAQMDELIQQIKRLLR